jgi:ferric-dicitrate binding protein FerR (iron transport regulator)
MKGECFFDVVKDPQHPFVVKGSKFKVKVFGTRFNVNEENSKNRADVTLVSGKVQVLSLQDKLISELNPGQQLVCRDGKCNLQQAENLEALTAWLNNMLIFDNQPFEEVIHYLEKWYGVKIQLDHELYYSHNYTFKVKTESLREVMELISVITPIEYKIEGEQVTIKYKKR